MNRDTLRRLWQRSLAATFAIGLAIPVSCMGPTALYPGSQRSDDEVGVVQLVTNGAIYEVGGRATDGRHFALLPGRHPVRFRVIVPGSEIHSSLSRKRRTGHCGVQIEVEAGHHDQIDRTRLRQSLETLGEHQTASSSHVLDYVFDVLITDFDSQGNEVGVYPVTCHW